MHSSKFFSLLGKNISSTLSVYNFNTRFFPVLSVPVSSVEPYSSFNLLDISICFLYVFEPLFSTSGIITSFVIFFLSKPIVMKITDKSVLNNLVSIKCNFIPSFNLIIFSFKILLSLSFTKIIISNYLLIIQYLCLLNFV